MQLISAISQAIYQGRPKVTRNRGAKATCFGPKFSISLGSSVYRWGTSDSGFGPRQLSCGVHFRRGYLSFKGKSLPDPAQSSSLSRSDQWHAVTASFLGWTLDAFDFFVLVFLMDTLAAHFHVDKSKIVETLFFTLVSRPSGAL